MLDEKVIAKIQKVLAMTASPYPEEAQAAMLKAQELMLQHGLTMGDINLDKAVEKEVVDVPVYETARLSWWVKSLSSIIADNFRCSPYYKPKSYYSPARQYFIGLKEDVALAKEVFLYATKTVEYLAKDYYKKHPHPWMSPTAIKNDFIRGFLNGLQSKFREQVASNAGYALVLVKDALVVKEVNKHHFRKGHASSVMSAGDRGASAAGYEAGRSFDGSKKMIGG